MFSLLKPKKCALALLGSGILAFGLYNIHALSGVTEGGVLGMTLFLHHWIGLSPALSGLVLNALCYWLGWKLLGREFIAYSIVAGGGFSLFYGVCEQFDPLWPQLAEHPLLAAVLAVVLTLSVGAAVLVDWDDIFTGYFGPDAAETPMAEKAFQKVNVISVCDDVAVTIREALVSEKNLYLILDYRLPDTVDRELVEMAYESEDWQAN